MCRCVMRKRELLDISNKGISACLNNCEKIERRLLGYAERKEDTRGRG